MDARALAAEAIGHKAIQKPWEFSALISLVQDLQPKVAVEIGSDAGGTLYAWTRIARRVFSIDLPGGAFRSHQPEDFNAWGANCYAGNSHDHQAKLELVSWLGKDPIDFLFIDGDHTYEGARKDWDMYVSLVRIDGMVALHDICWHGRPEVGVDRLWSEVARDRPRTMELIQTPTNWGGIGVWMK